MFRTWYEYSVPGYVVAIELYRIYGDRKAKYVVPWY